MAVELNFSKPLALKFILNGKEQRIVYEGLLRICFTCGFYRHTKEVCTNQNKALKMKEQGYSQETKEKSNESPYGF